MKQFIKTIKKTVELSIYSTPPVLLVDQPLKTKPTGLYPLSKKY